MIAARKPEGSAYQVLAAMNPKAMVAKGMSEAYIGHSVHGRPVAVYDYETCIDIVMREKSMTHSQAVDYLSLHVVPDSPGENLPIFIVTH